MILPSQNPTQFCLFLRTGSYTNCGYCGQKITHFCAGTQIQTKKCSYWIKTGPKCHLPSSLAVFWTRSNISAFSSAANRLGTSPAANHNFDNQSESGDKWTMAIWKSECHADVSSEPVVRIMLMSSKKASSFIWRSVKRKTTWTRKWMRTQKLRIIKGLILFTFFPSAPDLFKTCIFLFLDHYNWIQWELEV